MRPQSPEDRSLIALRLGRDRDQYSPDRKRRKSSERENREGLRNINRWSHSTSSSVGSIGGLRGPADSGAILGTGQYSPQKHNRAGSYQSPATSPRKGYYSSQLRRLSPEPNPNSQRRKPSLQGVNTSILPPQHAPPALSDPNDTESPSTMTVATPSTQSHSQDYFVDEGASPRSTAKSNTKTPAQFRSYTAPMADHSRAPGSQDSQTSLPKSPSSHDNDVKAGPVRTTRRDSRTRESRDRDKKTMLAKALQQANTAVLLDNAQNFEGALEAYGDACRLLQQVMDRSYAPEDKRKLEAIRVTYYNRIDELRELETTRSSASDDKSLPARPMSDDSTNLAAQEPKMSPVNASFDLDAAIVEPYMKPNPDETPRLASPDNAPDDFFTMTMEAVTGSSRGESSFTHRDARNVDSSAAFGAEDLREAHNTGLRPLHLSRLSKQQYVPAPLLPRKPGSPSEEQPNQEEPIQVDLSVPEEDHSRRPRSQSNVSTSWLAPIDESDAGSDASSMHSIDSKTGEKRRIKHIRGESNPDFDAAFDAAVEAAYDEGFEPDLEGRKKRETMQRVASQDGVQPIYKGLNLFNSTQLTNKPLQSTDEDDEEKLLLDEMTSDFAQNFQFDYSNKSALPRQSDSSGFSRSTWQSSNASTDRTTATTSLSTVAEDGTSARLSRKSSTPSSLSALRPEMLPPPPPVPTLATSPSTPLPPVPGTSPNVLPPPPPLPLSAPDSSTSVRNRRLSAQSNPKQLKIETLVTRPDTRKRASTFHTSPVRKPENEKPPTPPDHPYKYGSSLDISSSNHLNRENLKSASSADVPSETGLPTSGGMSGEWKGLERDANEVRAVRPSIFRKNKSSMSLRTDQSLTLSSPDHDSMPAATPMSSTFMSFASKTRSQDALVSHRGKFPSFDAGNGGGITTGGSFLFNTSLTDDPTALSPRSPDICPPGLEPCPESFLLRPFWLMRSMGSTITHPKGGFMSEKLFVPREVWQTRGVKLKSVEEKIANCDLLTAALGRLAGVDTYDADALMEELQGFEEVMERVQVVLAKRLGSEVGVHGVAGMFNAAPTPVSSAPSTQDTTAGAEKTKSKESGKSSSYLSSWRKLRSKSSGAPLNHGFTGGNSTDKEKDKSLMASVPMTAFVAVERRGQKREVKNTAYDGPNREYMSSLARLFDAAQVLDQVARQVEDPGLKHSSPTHVGLELSIRHAAEFFGFYICRFVLADIGTLMDKYLKKGSEWVLT
ncbi:Hypothetical protein R9X50_00298400 [Acrodontium crateriforme]|uniref:MIT domain-containing protein n=1 Tax=Acrodontium crateriforme TaxID=150365 RepID=A0AAQ3M5D4_9PEZI|nr:Hypothetical protein R9X50_00298400 [Acrodontium crateriforme]